MAKRFPSLFNNELVMSEDLTETIRTKINDLPGSAKADYLKSEVFSKFVSTDTDPAEVRRVRAISKWLATERNNESTNERLLLTPEEYNILPRVTYGQFMTFCRGLCEEILGATVPVDALVGIFSGGASTSRKRTDSHPAGKYIGKAHVTLPALSVFTDLVEEMPGWIGFQDELDIQIVPGNVMFTVPKKTDIDRVACKEPDLNMFIQKGLGNAIRRKLRSVGINLNDQSINRSLARRGSMDGTLATLDLSSASDSISSVLVAEMLPVCWHTLLDSVRSHVTIIDGVEHRNEMFSSMGNGFTFELESLLFYVLTRAVCYFRGIPGIVSVYGDDIICPSVAAQDVEWVFGYFGFEVNPKKSFSVGPFRESCGGHYYDGFDITPFYIKAPVKTVTDLIHVANSLRKWAEIGSHLHILDPQVEEIWLWLKSLVPSCLWGGVDTSFKYQLVSHDKPQLRISEETKSGKTGLGGYFHWLNATWDRQVFGDAVVTSSLTKNLNRFRLRPAIPSGVNRLESYFLCEL